MFDVTIFLPLLAAHFCGDVLAYTPAVSKHKRDEKKVFKLFAVVLHSFIHAIFCLLWLFGKPITVAVVASVFILLFHGIIDSFRLFFENRIIGNVDIPILTRRDIFSLLFPHMKPVILSGFMQKFGKRWVVLNLIDQFLHIVSLITVCYLLSTIIHY